VKALSEINSPLPADALKGYDRAESAFLARCLLGDAVALAELSTLCQDGARALKVAFAHPAFGRVAAVAARHFLYGDESEDRESLTATVIDALLDADVLVPEDPDEMRQIDMTMFLWIIDQDNLPLSTADCLALMAKRLTQAQKATFGRATLLLDAEESARQESLPCAGVRETRAEEAGR
jgi:hypothetical protein